MAIKPPPAAVEAKGSSSGKLKTIVLVVVALLLAIGLSVGATWFVLSKDDDKTEAVAPVAAAPGKLEALYEPLVPAFVVTLNHQGRARYMQVSMTLMSRDAAALAALKVHMPMLRNRLVMTLSEQDFETLSAAAGKELLRQQITASVQALAQEQVGSAVIEQVLFTNFVLQ